MEQLQRKGFDIESLRFEDPHRRAQEDESPRESASPVTIPGFEAWESKQQTMEYLQSFMEQPTSPQVVSDLPWHYGDTTQPSKLDRHTQPIRWQSSDSYFGMTASHNVLPIVDPLSGRLVRPPTMYSSLEDSSMVLS